MSSSILLKNGVALIHGSDDHVVPTKTDILVTGNKIAKVAPGISPPAGAEVVDCTDKIISPGFVSTHSHLWQTQLRGRFANMGLLQYMMHGMSQGSNFTADDIFWGQLGGCVEAIDNGVTAVVDHSHSNYSPEHADSVIGATVSSGIRSVFAYCPTPIVERWNPYTLSQNLLADWVMQKFAELAERAPFGPNGRVQLGLAWDAWFLPKEAVLSVFEQATKAGAPLITTHFLRSPEFSAEGDSIAKLIHSYGLLNDRLLLSHCNGADAEDAKLIAGAGAHTSTTPSTELQMAIGPPVCLSEDTAAMASLCSLGVDCHTATAGSVIGEARLALQAARHAASQRLRADWKAPSHPVYDVEHVYNLSTIMGARAMRSGDKFGSIAEGKLADLVVFDATSPSMVCGAEHDPVAALVLHSSVRDIDTVIVDGVIRKRDGKLLPVQVEDDFKKLAGKDTLEWSDIARALTRSREGIMKKIEGIDFDKERDNVINALGAQKQNIVEV